MDGATADYQRILRDELARRCDANPRYSLRAFARALGMSPSTLSRLLTGGRRPSYDLAKKILDKINLTPEVRRQFIVSLGAGSAFGLDESTQSVKVRELSHEVFRVVADWYHYAILELTFTAGFKPDPRWIATELGISVTEAKLAADRLFELGLLEKRGARWIKGDAYLSTADKHLTSDALKRRQKQVLNKAIQSVDEHDIDVRSMTTMTMAIDPALLPEAKRRILAFNRELCAFLESGKRKEVYELAVGLFPVQQKGSSR